MINIGDDVWVSHVQTNQRISISDPQPSVEMLGIFQVCPHEQVMVNSLLTVACRPALTSTSLGQGTPA